mmetsp:Transcript_1831/g.3914  ORF Transcript_1831/g.3914 Transcript_1831/m.3914 type:complete len:396 (-) Transcript_1831:586-1773(-)
MQAFETVPLQHPDDVSPVVVPDNLVRGVVVEVRLAELHDDDTVYRKGVEHALEESVVMVEILGEFLVVRGVERVHDDHVKVPFDALVSIFWIAVCVVVGTAFAEVSMFFPGGAVALWGVSVDEPGHGVRVDHVRARILYAGIRGSDEVAAVAPRRQVLPTGIHHFLVDFHHSGILQAFVFEHLAERRALAAPNDGRPFDVSVGEHGRLHEGFVVLCVAAAHGLEDAVQEDHAVGLVELRVLRLVGVGGGDGSVVAKGRAVGLRDEVVHVDPLEFGLDSRHPFLHIMCHVVQKENAEIEKLLLALEVLHTWEPAQPVVPHDNWIVPSHHRVRSHSKTFPERLVEVQNVHVVPAHDSHARHTKDGKRQSVERAPSRDAPTHQPAAHVAAHAVGRVHE